MADLIVWLWPTAAEVASGANSLTFVAGALTAAWLLSKWWPIRSATEPPLKVAAFHYSVWAISLIGLSVRTGAWQPYYIWIATGETELANWYLQIMRAPLSALTAISGFTISLHLRYVLEKRIGWWWLPALLVALVTVYLAHAYVPRLL